MKSLLLLTTLFLFHSFAAEQVLTSSHYSVSGPWDTKVVLYNPQRVDVAVTLCAFDAAGQKVDTISWLVPAEGGFAGSFADLFPNLEASSGWFQIEDPSGTLEGYSQYLFHPTGAAAVAPFSRQGGRRIAMLGLAGETSTFTGLAVVNGALQQAKVTCTLKFADGRPAAVTHLQLAPGQKYLGLLRDLFDGVPRGVTLVLEADQSIYAMGLDVGFGFLQMNAGVGEILPGNPEQRVADLADIEGSWRRLGYAQTMVFEGEDFYLIDSVDGRCGALVFNAAVADIGLALYLDDNDLLRVDVPVTAETYYLERSDSMPETCALDADPERNLEAFIAAFQQHFAFFPAIDYDWPAAVAAARAAVGPNTDEQTLFEVLTELQDPTNDGHGTLVTPFDESDPEPMKTYTADVYAQFLDQQEITDWETFYELQEQIWDETLRTYVTDLKTSGNGFIRWGKLNDHTGYLAFSLMFRFAGPDGDPLEEAEALEAALDRVFADVGDLPYMVLDNRWNPGGDDGLAQAVASRFADKPRLAYSEKGRVGDGFTPWRSHWVKPHATRPTYQGDVVYLTSSNTNSAAEILTFLMRPLPNVLHFGERTSGALSDALEVTLPNGWQVTLSNEIYLDHEGHWFEYKGIPPQVSMPHFPRSDREKRRDSLLEAALTYTKN